MTGDEWDNWDDSGQAKEDYKDWLRDQAFLWRKKRKEEERRKTPKKRQKP